MSFRALRFGMLLVALASAADAADVPKVTQADYDKMLGCLGAFDGVTWVLTDLAPQMQEPAKFVDVVIGNKTLSGQIGTNLRKLEAAQPELDKLEAGAAYVMAKQPWDDVRKQGLEAELAYWKANGATSDDCTMKIMRITALGAMLSP